MSLGQKLIYGAVMALAVFFVGQVVLGVGSIVVNTVFAVLMGAFAVVAVSIAQRLAKRNE